MRSVRFDAWNEARYNQAAPTLDSRGLRRRPMVPGLHTILPQAEPSGNAAGSAGRNRLRFTRGEALSPIGRNRSIDDGATVNALPGVKNEKEV